jgi:hypothetical protein
MIPLMQASVFATDLQLIIIVWLCAPPATIWAGFEDLSEPSVIFQVLVRPSPSPQLSERTLAEKFRWRCRGRDLPTRSPLRHFRKFQRGKPALPKLPDKAHPFLSSKAKAATPQAASARAAAMAAFPMAIRVSVSTATAASATSQGTSLTAAPARGPGQVADLGDCPETQARL